MDSLWLDRWLFSVYTVGMNNPAYAYEQQSLKLGIGKKTHGASSA